MLSQTAEYALRAMLCLADCAGQPRTVAEIARMAKVPAGYLAKVMQSLVKAGLVTSQRGLRGGFTLRREPAAVTVLEVVDAVDPLRRIERCPLDRPEHAGRLCALHRRLDEVIVALQASFRETTIGSLLADEDADRRPLCLGKTGL
ncbi:MAG: Rrf2 family transcriptional regulator [Acidobacteria bacterium]|jgi:Rrf2 family protein|nr:Rrf2 family transcriptional regulator [Acidobacteriota bacterium]